MLQRNNGGKMEVFDEVRKKWVPLTEEEKVRQWLLHFMVEQKHIPMSHISVERQITVNGFTRRYDIVVFDKQGLPQLVIECKAPSVQLSQKVLEQVGQYNQMLRAPFIGVSNGVQHFFFQIDFTTGVMTFLDDFPQI